MICVCSEVGTQTSSNEQTQVYVKNQLPKQFWKYQHHKSHSTIKSHVQYCSCRQQLQQQKITFKRISCYSKFFLELFLMRVYYTSMQEQLRNQNKKSASLQHNHKTDLQAPQNIHNSESPNDKKNASGTKRKSIIRRQCTLLSDKTRMTAQLNHAKSLHATKSNTLTKQTK